MPTPRRKSPNDGRYDRGEERARRFGKVIHEWLEEPGAPSTRDVAGFLTQYTGHLVYDNEVRRVEGGRSGIAHLAKDDGRLIEAYLAAFGKTSLKDRARAFRAVGIVPQDMSEADLMLGMASSKSRVA